MPRARSHLAAALVAALGLATVAAFGPGRARADDDWGVKRNPFDRSVIDRWKGILARDPSDSAALKQLVGLYQRYSTVDKLVAEYEAAPESYARDLVLAELYRQRPDLDQALAWFGKAATASPSEAAPVIARAEIWKQTGKKAEAAAAYDQALPLVHGAKQKRVVLRAVADLALDAGDVAKARAAFQASIDLDPNDVTTRLDLADALAKHQLHEEALAAYREAEKRLGTDPARRVEVLAREGAELEALSKTQDAVALYRKAMAETQRGHFLRKELTERVIDIYRKDQDLRELLASNEKEWPVSSRGHFEWDVLARLYEEVGDQDKALDAYRHAVAAAPGELDTQKRLIALLQRAGREDDLIKQYEVLIRVAPGEPRFQLELAERIWKKGDKTRARALAEGAASRFPDDAGVHSALADLFTRWGDDKRALKEWETLVRIEPSDDTHLVNLGEQYHQRGDKTRALDTWKRIALAKTPEAYARLAEVYSEHDLGAEAVDMYQKALALKPRDPTLWKGLAGVYERLRQDDRALDAWERVMDVTGADPLQKLARREARTRIITILNRKSGQPLLAATRDWARRFDAKPPDLEAGYRLAEAYLKLGRQEDAEQILRRILVADSTDLDAKNQLVAVYRTQRKYNEAIELLKQLAADQPALERQYDAEIAELELALYHDEEAIAYAQKALEKSPNDPQAQERLAEIYTKKEDFKSAIDAYKRAIALSPRNFQVHIALAKLYLRDGQNQDAAALYREVVKHATDDETVRAAARKAIDLEEYLGTLGDLERDLAPLAFQISNKATYRRILVELYDRYVPPLVARARAGDADAAKELLRLGEHGLKPLLEALEDATDPQQQRAAVRVLGYLGNKNAAPPLVKLAFDAPAAPTVTPGPTPTVAATDAPTDMDVRVEALVAAGRLGDPRVAPQLVLLLGNREVALREAAAWALGQTRSPQATAALITALGDSRSSVHALACVGLGRSGDKRALDRVAEVMNDPAAGAEARAACAYALGAARSAAHVQALTDVVAAGNDDVQLKAAWALGRIGDARAVPALLRAYWQRKPAVRDAIVWALATIAAGGDASAPESADVSLEAGKIDYRALVRGMTSEVGAPPALDAAVLSGHAVDLVAGIKDALALTGRRDVVLRTLRDLDAADDGLAFGTLSAGADRAALQPLFDGVGGQIAPAVDALCDSRDVELRLLAIDVSAKLGGPAAVHRVLAGLDDDAPAVRLAALGSARRALRAHGAAGPDGALLVAAVQKRLGARAWQERAAAADALGATAGIDPAPLAAALADPSGFVRESVARALGAARRPEAVAPLLSASRDEIPEVRIAAIPGLAASANPDARARLIELMDDGDRAVRTAAQRAHDRQ